ncbi:MAG: hypothetical protein QW514_04660, partial [Thermoprotei archaeon]
GVAHREPQPHGVECVARVDKCVDETFALRRSRSLTCARSKPSEYNWAWRITHIYHCVRS